MAKRFGRNQRRKLKEQVAALEQQALRDGVRLQEEQLRNMGLNSTVEDIIYRLHRVFGEDTWFTDILNYYSTRGVRLNYLPNHGKVTFDPLRGLEAVSETVKTTMLHAFVTELETRDTDGSLLVRFIDRNHLTDDTCFMISREALNRVGFDKRDVKYWSDRVAHEILEHINIRERRHG